MVRMQIMYSLVDGAVQRLELPSSSAYLMPGVRWGAFDELLTPAYWRGQVWQHEAIGGYREQRLGSNLIEEVCACLLGGYGMPAEVGLAAFARLRDEKLLEGTPTPAQVEYILAQPLIIRSVPRSYRFPRQKARYLSACLHLLAGFEEPTSDIELRDSLATLPGIGNKTASWVVRNYRTSNNVAVIDVHILRAGQHVGLFDLSWRPQRHYQLLEDQFLRFCGALDVAPSMLDGLIWDYMRRMPLRLRVPKHDAHTKVAQAHLN